jgi:hypothetical protein
MTATQAPEGLPFYAKILGLAGGIHDADPSQAPERELQVRGLQLFLLLHVTARAWLTALSADDFDQEYLIPLALVASCALLLGLFKGWTRSATGLAAIAWTARFYFRWPQSSNHFYLEWICLAFVWLLAARGDDNRKLLLQAVRFVVVIAIFYTGAQKVMYGSYFQGQFLAWEIATKENFAVFFQPFLRAEEFSRLRHIHPERLGAGPFVVNSPIFLAMSNSVYLCEMLAPLLLLLRRTRVLATSGFLLFMLAVEAGAFELLFGLLMLNLLLIFFPRAINYRALPAVAACYLALFVARYAFGLEFFQ